MKMASLRAFASYNLHRILDVGRRRSSACTPTLYRAPNIMMPTMHGSILSTGKGFSTKDDRRVHSNSRAKMEKDTSKDKRVGLVVQSSRKPTFPTWVRWTLGAILSLILPFWKKKWEGLLRLQDEVEEATEAVENVAEVVEKVAGVAEQVSAVVADKLLKDGTLKDTALLVKRVSEEAIKDAHLTEDLIHKVNELKQEVMETVVEPIIDPGQLLDKHHEK